MTTPTDSCIVRIDAAEATFRLDTPVLVGGSAISERTYTFVRITGSGGEVGCAYGLTRGLPVAAALERLVAPHYLSQATGAPADTHERVSRRLGFLGTDSGVRRALSLLDIACWDLAGKCAGRPVADLLGRREAIGPRLVAVDGYLLASGPTAVVRQRVGESVERGISTIKFAWPGDARAMRAAIGEAMPEAVDASARVIVDLLWSLPSAADGKQVAAYLDDLDLAWVEDPYPAHVLMADAAAREAFAAPIAFGDEATDPYALYELAGRNRIDIIRVDATTVGGLTGAVAVISKARELGKPVACHIYPEIHQHLAFSASAADYLELFPADGCFDAATQFRLRTVELDHGEIVAPTAPGLGLALDWHRIARHSSQTVRVG